MRYRIATNPRELAHADMAHRCHEVQGVHAAGVILESVGYEGCAVWRFDARARHWHIIFDTSLPDASRLPGRDYWRNVAAHELAQGGKQ